VDAAFLRPLNHLPLPLQMLLLVKILALLPLLFSPVLAFLRLFPSNQPRCRRLWPLTLVLPLLDNRPNLSHRRRVLPP
jgi:hypothetical protein